jgi:predicted RNA binding protein YcfA (HicA-like mRNA interferase family)
MARMPQVSARELVRFLKKQGSSRSGNRAVISRSGTAIASLASRVPVHTGADIGRGLAARVPKDAGFTVEDHLRLR